MSSIDLFHVNTHGSTLTRLTLNGADFPVRIRCAFSWSRRALGLLLQRDLPESEGLLLRPCASVHTIGMAYAIDVVFLSREGRVQRVVTALKPGRFAASDRAGSVLELRAGAADRLGVRVGGQFSSA